MVQLHRYFMHFNTWLRSGSNHVLEFFTLSRGQIPSPPLYHTWTAKISECRVPVHPRDLFLGQFSSTTLGPKSEKSVPDLYGNFRGSWLNSGELLHSQGLPPPFFLRPRVPSRDRDPPWTLPTRTRLTLYYPRSNA